MAKKAAKARATAKKKSAGRKAAARKRPAVRALATAFRGGHVHEDDSVCGCDFEFSEADATPDAMLPEARGGVESLAAARRR